LKGGTELSLSKKDVALLNKAIRTKNRSLLDKSTKILASVCNDIGKARLGITGKKSKKKKGRKVK
jgi:hypothetical protein